jgi:hypothetical protein
MELWTLRVLHISAGVASAGFAMFLGWFLMPALRDAGPGGSPVMGALLKRRLPVWMNVLGLIVVLTGLRLYMLYFNGNWLKTGTGIVLTLGAVLGLGAFFIGMMVSRPTAMKLGALNAVIAAAGGKPTPDQSAQLQALSAKAFKAARLNAWHLAGATLCMALARYFPGG